MKCNPKLFDLIGHIIVPIPFIVISIYIISINANIFWMKIVGSTLLILGIIFLIFSLALIALGLSIYFLKAKKSCRLLNLHYNLLALFTLILDFIVLYYTSLRKEFEIEFWVQSFIQNNVNQQITEQFIISYNTYEKIHDFVRQHTFQCHDALIFMTFISVFLFFFLIYHSNKTFDFIFNGIEPKPFIDLEKIPLLDDFMTESEYQEL